SHTPVVGARKLPNGSGRRALGASRTRRRRPGGGSASGPAGPGTAACRGPQRARRTTRPGLRRPTADGAVRGLCRRPRPRRRIHSSRADTAAPTMAPGRAMSAPAPLSRVVPAMPKTASKPPSRPAAPGSGPSPSSAPLRAAVTAAWALDEAAHVRELLAVARQPAPGWGEADRAAVRATATDLVRRVRARAADQGAIEAFMRQYDLASDEGVLLMCVAEALLRIPDEDTADLLIRDKLGEADWRRHVGRSDSVLVNASTWGLMLTGRLVDLADETRRDVRGAFRRLVGRVGEPVIRLAVRQAMRIMGRQFVMGRSIGEALARSRKGGNAAYRYSFDMLGEAALTRGDADRYLEAYADAIDAIGANGRASGGHVADAIAAPSISVKLSALHPRY